MRPNSQAGFTYVELMVALAILGLVIVTVGGLLDLGVQDWHRGETRVEAEQNIRVAMERMSRDLRSARGFTANAGGNSLEMKAPGNIIIRYYLDSQETTGPGGLRGKTLLRTVKKYADENYTNPPLSAETGEVAGYFESVEFTYCSYNPSQDDFLESPSPELGEMVRTRYVVRLSPQETMELSTGTAPRGKFLPRG